jgi:hypothetical protein
MLRPAREALRSEQRRPYKANQPPASLTGTLGLTSAFEAASRARFTHKG